MTTPHASIARRLATVLTLAALGLCVACASPVSPELTSGMQDMPRQERERRERALREADKAFRADDPARAEELYISAIRQYPDFGQAWNNLGVALMAQDRFLEAGEAFDRAADLQPTDPRPPYNRGLLWFERGYLRDSMPHFLEAIERDPNYLPALRSAIRAAVLLRDTSPETLVHIRTALLIEKDEKWRNYFERQRLLIEANLSAESAGTNESL
jgi:tetratricopeptide (TPR) repeat protein